MTFIQTLEQSGSLSTFVILMIISFLLGLLIGISRKGKANKARETEELASAPGAIAYPQQADNSGKLVAVITAAVNEYRKNNI